MSTQLIPFFFKSESSHKVRVYIDESDNHWFVAKDVAIVLGYSWKGIATVSYVPAEWRGVYSVQTPSEKQEMLCLSEQGLYFFLARSDKPKALPFQKWIAGEVLPALRKTGQYSVSSYNKDAKPVEAAQQSLSVFPATIPNLPAYDRKSVNSDRQEYLWEPLLDWCRALTGGLTREDISFLEAVTARAACRPSFSSIPMASLPIVREWLLERVEEARSGKVAPMLPRLPLRKLDDIKNKLLILEAAIASLDSGEPELQDAMCVEVLEVIKQVEAMGA